LKKEFIKIIKNHIKDNPKFRSVADFARYAIGNQIKKDLYENFSKGDSFETKKEENIR